MALGLVITTVAQHQMGSSWRIGIDDRPTELITHGHFLCCRNPIFSGMIATLLGLVMIAPATWTVGGFLVACCLIAIQVRLEEDTLLRVHGHRYRAYARCVGRFVPMIGRFADDDRPGMASPDGPQRRPRAARQQTWRWPMELSTAEFRAMNNPFRRFVQKHVEFQIFESMRLAEKGQDILEIGCGSGYGAVLLATVQPRSYIGIDLMQDQIELARRLDLPRTTFSVMDATDLGAFEDESKDLVVIFGILHHIPSWRRALAETYRVLRAGGALYVEEPDSSWIRFFDRIFHFKHPDPSLFGLDMLERELVSVSFNMSQRRRIAGFGLYGARKEAGLRNTLDGNTP